ncbi:MAG: hypothetical protein WD208_09930 [Dehalococcoidia bacterium]
MRYVRMIRAIMLSTLATGLLAACGNDGGPGEEFTASETFDDGSLIELTGNTAGHAGGDQSDFSVLFRNGDGSGEDVEAGEWASVYCVVLMDSDAPMMSGGDSFAIPEGLQVENQLQLVLPPGLAEGAYGLAIVVPDHGSVSQTIWVGDEGDETGASWPVPPECSQP